MSENQVITGFPERLREAMLTAGLHSNRSKSGVCIQDLTKITGYSRQICRKYLEGKTIPEPRALLKLAQALQVNAGWLLFGDGPKQSSPHDIIISKTLLHYVLTSSMQTTHPDALINLIHEISQLPGDEAHLKRIVDLAFSI
ncbi:MAG: helix-turn-helix domain-containing protein [Gammaproteobacteria bacterium]|nr:helix-turn-helix domain-containing protein [Gammaproteobacteria bacterium]